MKYVKYGKVFPPPTEELDGYFTKPYTWLSKYCGYCPQIWLGRGSSSITGYKNKVKEKKRTYTSRNVSSRKNDSPDVMFAFDVVKGFPLDYEIWCFCLSPLADCKNPVKDGDDAIKREFAAVLKDFENDPAWGGEWDCDVSKLPHHDIIWKWANSKNYEDFLSKYFFIKNDQVVVPSLNLKVAKRIFCRNEKQVKALRKMGFIKDRIKILNSKQWD